ncbi:MAG TPA: 5-(carboxyamino)imidazole ribonucleotide mutase [Candidatus Limnocylindrales bacterium]|nr:5-(carboxyamino)imidazole ribonucleotide mutase [Candidatus Limnocylindrales bacterium]
MNNDQPLVGIIMGSDSDLPVMSEAGKILEEFGIPHEVDIVSAHRTPQKMYDYAKSASERGLKVIIAGASAAAHLPGMTASITTLPVIGVPVKGINLDGMDSLLSIVQMPPGIPVATVSINGARNAGILAAKIIGITDPEISKKISQFQEALVEKVKGMEEKLEKSGYQSRADEIKEGKR